MGNPKTKTDVWFENYLLQEGFEYTFEPFGPSNEKNPDFLINTKKKVLVECKEIEQIELDTVKGAGSLDIVRHWNLIRKRIYSASQQLKPFAGRVDHSVVILGKVKGFPISTNDLFYAMFGDPVIRIPIVDRREQSSNKAELDFKVMGALRKNNPQTKQMYFPHDYVSAVGIIQELDALGYYRQNFYDKKLKGIYKKEKPLGDQIDKALRKADIEWKNHEVPEEYASPTKKLYKLRIIINPLSKNPLPRNFFHGHWDEIRVPKKQASNR